MAKIAYMIELQTVCVWEIMDIFCGGKSTKTKPSEGETQDEQVPKVSEWWACEKLIMEITIVQS